MKTKYYNGSRIAVILLALAVQKSAIAEELFYENCVDGKCEKRYLVRKDKISDAHFKVKIMLLEYRSKSSADAEEQYRFADVVCDKDKPTVAWANSKPQNIDKRIFVQKIIKKGKKSFEEPPKTFDAETNLWKKICRP